MKNKDIKNTLSGIISNLQTIQISASYANVAVMKNVLEVLTKLIEAIPDDQEPKEK